ncbi:secretion protein HlyD family protein [Geobacter metallireducens RCH3]|uniref:Multidrug resistance efflux pump, RND family, membrane fusion protein EmrA n=1 Tax=Geobacter metallireducens (strain ATCC 53774 / DSM 7210 / GS-15) TaxID=269799 RepID=Q39VW5_GEOMG|nr:HlyD family secretion protein [Geobacter metallireducens]ABB31609.1 multidrug resistance efflux pump, RND family, membrane fusion protein EmrA [Geobacter metallireducens GS-15]EHP86630.1 secretion protein HlyD family protein [Geobacter metallireducens RCH3]
MAVEESKENQGAGETARTATDTAGPAGKQRGGKRTRAGIILLAVIAIGLFMGTHWFLRSKTLITTDNAFVEAHIHAISPRVSGTVTAVPVMDNQFVKKGETLVELDPTDYEVRVRSAAADLDMARNETSGDYAQVEAARAAVSHARARLDQAELDLRRGSVLFTKEVIPREQLDRLETARRVTAAQLREAEEGVRKAQAELGLAGTGGKEARVAQREAKLREASLSLSYTRIVAPVDGYVTRKSVETGSTVQAGQPLMAVVALNDTWVTANYKESQLAHMKPGQKVTFTVDAYPSRTFTGRVDSIMAGTGAAFSLLPSENATGNYVKVVQRVPVKIVVDTGSDPRHLLRVGMSVIPTVNTGRKLGEILRDFRPF